MNIPQEIIKTAVYDGKSFKSFGISPLTASLYGHKEDEIIEIKITVAADQTKPSFEQQQKNKNADYWGWWDDVDKKMSFIHPQLFILNMCFPYSYEAEEERGRGKALRINVEKNL